MNADADNPYRFTSDASEENDPSPELARRLTLEELRSVARGRRLLIAFLAMIVGSCAVSVTAIALAPAPHMHAGPMYAPYINVAVAAIVTAFLGMIGLCVVGMKMMRLSARRYSAFEELALFVPVQNAIVALKLRREARRMLESGGVRLGWFADDYSHVRID